MKVVVNMKKIISFVADVDDPEIAQTFANEHTPDDAELICEKFGADVSTEYENSVTPVAAGDECLYLGKETYFLLERGGEVEKITKTSDGCLFQNCYRAADTFFITVSKAICFSDCSDERVKKIVFCGKEFEYVGWQPDMLFEFRPVGEQAIFWSRNFPRWDH